MDDAITVIGSGSWGTALTVLLTHNHHSVKIFCNSPQVADEINLHRSNKLYLPDTTLPSAVSATTDLEAAINVSKTLYFAIPTRYLRPFCLGSAGLWRNWDADNKILVNCSKGLLIDPPMRTGEYFEELLPQSSIVHLSGPNLAGEIMAGLPAAAVAAGPREAAEQVQQQINSERYRVYTADDSLGVEVAGFYKNIIAIAAGTLMALEMGDNTRAVLITRGMAEMARLVSYFGGDPLVVYGLAGMGDLIATCSSPKSRNFQTGFRLGKGEKIDEIVGSMNQVAEGVQASKALQQWPRQHAPAGSRANGIRLPWPELPIAEEVYKLVHEGADARECITRLMQRPPKAE